MLDYWVATSEKTAHNTFPCHVLFLLFQGIAPGSYVTQCNATDADAGANADVTYRIVEGSANKFSINNSTGVITTTAQLDRESGVSEFMVSGEKRFAYNLCK